MAFNWTVSIGDILSVSIALGALLKLYGKFTEMNFKIEHLWEWYNKHHFDFPPPSKHNNHNGS